MGQKFTITEQERKQIRGLYEQNEPIKSEEQITYEIVRGGGVPSTKGIIIIKSNKIDINVKLYKTELVGILDVVKKMNSGNNIIYQCTGDILGYDKHVLTIMEGYHTISWQMINSFAGGTSPSINLVYKK